MPTLNAFTSACKDAAKVGAVVLLCGLGGCLANPLGDAAGAEQAAARTATVTPGVDGAGPSAAANYSVPKVKGRNAEDFASAVAAMKAGDLGLAERLLRGVTISQPELAGPWVNLGQVYLQLGQEEEARLAFRRAIAANPANCAAYNQLGVLSRKMGDFTAAENHYLKCLSADPASADVYLNLGILYELYLGRLGDALSAYRQYQTLSLEPDRKVAGWVLDLERRTDR